MPGITTRVDELKLEVARVDHPRRKRSRRRQYFPRAPGWLVGWMWGNRKGRGRIWGDSTTYVVRQQPAHAGNPFWVSMRRSRRRRQRRQRQREGAPYWIIVMESYWRQRVRQKQQQKKSKGPHFNHVFPFFCHLCAHAIFLPPLVCLLGMHCSPPCRRHLSKRRGWKTHTALSQKILPLPSFFHLCVFPVPDG